MKINLSISNFNMKKFIFKTSLFSLLIFTLLTSVNYFGDGAKLFHPGYENKIVDILFSSYNATNISNYDERILQRELINKIKENPDVVVLGSSRSMLINSTYFKDKKVINNSVSGASIEDLVAIYQMYATKNILPKKIILCVDPWLFNKNNGHKRWMSLNQEYNSFRNENVEIEESIFNYKMQQLFSFSYFQTSIKNLPNVISGKSEPIATHETYNQSNTKLVDASLSYGNKYRKVSNEQVYVKAKRYISGNIYSIENFKAISPEIFKEFKLLCRSIIQNDIELSFFLVPYHPLVYKKIEQDYRIVLKIENEVLSFAKENNIEFLGSFSPIIVGINSTGFYDGMHCKENAIKKIMKVYPNDSLYKSLGSW